MSRHSTLAALTVLLLAISIPPSSAWSSPASSPIETVAGGGPVGVAATAASVPVGRLDLDAAGNIYGLSRFQVFRFRPGGNVDVVAGLPHDGFSGDGGPAVEASFDNPSGLAVDAAGNIYVSDRINNRVRRIDAGTGAITTYAGTGAPGFSGDLALATAAAVGNPGALAVDPTGNLYINTEGRIRRVDAVTKIITTYAGNGVAAYCGDGGPALDACIGFPTDLEIDTAGNLYIAGGFMIRKVDAATRTITRVAGIGQQGSGGDGLPAVSVSLAHAFAVAADGAGNLLIADGYQGIRRVEAATGLISTVAGGSHTGFDGDGGPAVDAGLSAFLGSVETLGAGFLIADSGNLRVRMVDASGIITTIAGDGTSFFCGEGPGLGRMGTRPNDVAMDEAGAIYVLDECGGGTIRRLDPVTGLLTRYAGGGSSEAEGVAALEAKLVFPAGIAASAGGDIYVVETDVFDEDTFAHLGRNRVRKVDAATGLVTTVAGTGFFGLGPENVSATSSALAFPVDVTIGPGGDLFITESFNGAFGGGNRVRRVDAATGIIRTVAGTSFPPGYDGDGGPATGAQLWAPAGSAVDPATGDLYIADSFNLVVRKVDGASGIITTIAGPGQYGVPGDGGPALLADLWPEDLVFDNLGRLIILESNYHRVRVVDLATGIIERFAGEGTMGFGGDGGPAPLARLALPLGIASAGDVVLIADRMNERVRRVGPTPADVTPPQISVTLDPAVLWPPNHDLRDVTATVIATDDSGEVSVVLESIVSDEADDEPGSGDGKTTGDIRDAAPGTFDVEFLLRAERSSAGDGRTYTVTYRATDPSGNAATASATVTVPRQRAGLDDPVHVQIEETAVGTRLAWTQVPGASGYGIIRGDLRSLSAAQGFIDLGPVVCLVSGSGAIDTTGSEDASFPVAGRGYFYLVQYDDGRESGYGEAGADLPRRPGSGGCD